MFNHLKKIVVAALASFAIFSTFVIVPSPKVLAAEVNTVQNSEQVSEAAFAANSIYHTVTRMTVGSPGPSSITFHDTINGVWYKGTLFKTSEHVNPEGPYYFATYSGTVYKQ